MKHLFLSYELSQLAKRKGFNEDCLAWYYTQYGAADYKNKNLIIRYLEGLSYTKGHPSVLPAPLNQQIIDWFRDEKYLDIIVVPEDITFTGIVRSRTLHEAVFYSENNILYHEALNKAITEAFKLIL